MPTIDELPPATASADTDEIPVTQNGISRKVTRAQFLGGVQPALAAATGSLIGRASAGAGAVEVLTVGPNLSLSGTTLSATAAPYVVSQLPPGTTPVASDLVPLSQSNVNTAVPFSQFAAGMSALHGVDASQFVVTPAGGSTGATLAVSFANTLPKTGGQLQGPLLLATDPALARQAATKAYVDTRVMRAGDTVGGPLTWGSPNNPNTSISSGTISAFQWGYASTTANIFTQCAGILRNTPGAGLDVWLDGLQVAAAAANPLPPSAANVLLFGHSGAPDGGAQCWFHEAATWEHALGSTDIATLLSCATRWPRGARRGIVIVPIGQSNAGNALGDGAWHVLAQGVAWHLGAAAWNVVGNYGSSGSATCVGGHGIYAEPAAGLSGDFVHDPGDGSNPSGWAFGLDGTGVETVIGNAAPDSPDIAALLFPWSETDSVRPYSEAAKWQAAAERLIQLLRARLGKTAPLLPLLWWNPIPFPYGNAGGMQMVRERIAAMHADPAQNVVIAAPQTADSNQRGATWNPATGIQTGGDSSHRDAPDNIGFGRRMAPVAARAILAAGVADTLTSIPAGIPAVGGPVIASAHLTSPTTVLLTVAHDAGDDLRIPLQAMNGAGFAVMNGGSVASPGPVVPAVACAYVSPTQLQITLAGAVGPGASCLLFYPYGYASIGRGNAVTDNFSSVTKPAGWDIGHDLGSAWTADCPLAATLNPVQMT